MSYEKNTVENYPRRPSAPIGETICWGLGYHGWYTSPAPKEVVKDD